MTVFRSQRFRRAFLALVASGAALFSAPVLAAAPAAALGNPSIHCDSNCLLPNTDCGGTAPTSVDNFTKHARDRMAERGISEDQVHKAVELGARTAVCQNDGKWCYELGSADGILKVILVWSHDSTAVVVTVFWGEGERCRR